MQTVFVSGSIKLRKLHPKVLERLRTIVESELEIVVGDANGADKAFQIELRKLAAKRVTVYFSGTSPRNNVGDWKVERVTSNAKPGTREFFTAKDVRMSRCADFGMMLWDSKSTGTLKNVLELCKQNKPSVVFVAQESAFVSVKNKDGFNSLLTLMSNEDWELADRRLKFVEQEKQTSMQV